MDHEQRVQLEGRTVAHQLPPSKNDDVVCENSQSALLQRRHGRHQGLEVEVLGVKAGDGIEDFVEDGPQVNAERSVDTGKRQRLKQVGGGVRRHDG